MKRWTPAWADDLGCVMKPAADGEWVRWEDVAGQHHAGFHAAIRCVHEMARNFREADMVVGWLPSMGTTLGMGADALADAADMLRILLAIDRAFKDWGEL